jgi:hypothetical protein
MRLRPEWTFLIGAGGIFLPLCSPPQLFAQATVSVPFIGCASSGQTGTLEAPKSTNRSVSISPKDAQALAYYESANGISLLAPRGWYCEGASGSGGAALFLSPKPIHNTPSGWDGIEGTAIEINHISGENSGRYEIAELMARVFPTYRAVAIRVWEDLDFPLPSGPYPKDTLTYRGKTIVEYNTPAQTEGLGNFDSWLGKSDLPIRGIAILGGDPTRLSLSGEQPSLILLSVRLPPELARLAPTIIRYVGRDTR